MPADEWVKSDPKPSLNHADKLAARVVTRGLLVVRFGSTV
jgi:hypothetical protein